jgi:hypothetical protein
MLFIFTK